jgi:hypothetical protein
MSQDIDAILNEWPFQSDSVQARLIKAGDGRQIIQVRIDLGLLQMETTGRPDGARPNGFRTYFDYLKSLAAKKGPSFTLSEKQCFEADREFVQFYHRRLSWLALRQFELAVADADHTLAFMDLAREHSPSPEYTEAHEQYRAFVLFHRTQAAAARAAEHEQPEAAIDAIRQGLDRIRKVFEQQNVEDDRADEDGMVQTLEKMEQSLRELHGIDETLKEQLERAIANEDYEGAARLRDAIRQRQ